MAQIQIRIPCLDSDRLFVAYNIFETRKRKVFEILDHLLYSENFKILASLCRWTVDWLQSFKQFFINVSYHILVASLTLMALF